MKIYNGKWCSLKLLRSGDFYVKPFVKPVRESFSRVRWKEPSVYKSESVVISIALEFMWLWFKIRLDIKSEAYSSKLFVGYEDTHFALIGESLKVDQP